MIRQKLALVVNGSAPVGDSRMNGFSPVRMILLGSAAMGSSWHRVRGCFLFDCPAARDRQAPATDPVTIDNQNALSDILLCQTIQYLRHTVYGRRFAPVATPKQDQTRPDGFGERKQTGIVEIGGDNGPAFCRRSLHDGAVGSAFQTERDRVNGIMALRLKPL